MRIGKFLVALSVLTIAASLRLASPAAALQGHECSGAAAEAVSKLPMPLAKWGQIACTPFGQILMSQEGWVWVMPDASGAVFVPSQISDKKPEELGDKSYFTKIDVERVSGEEFDRIYRIFHAGFDDKEAKPDAYRVDIVTVSGKTMRMFFFDYDSYAWGMQCPDNTCDPDTRFMVLDKNRRPEPRRPAI